ncbi:peptide ABC transporter substrate-binding protein [Caviibacter abscessus]|uniref:peptide ABC transporter substrate-binding protein n=1 Tax=Caviibacter abscessus TaxID=1766719 RepID=UPI00083178F8|nr:peptide ABC transporter substrate-binding protein [Caviibacter abscessus]
MIKKILYSLLLAIFLISCNVTNKSGEKIISWNAETEGISFDPQILNDGKTMTIHGLVSRGLTYTKENGEVIPALAKSWDISKDGLTWTFHLRDNLKWSDGRPLTANDFIYGWSRALDPKVASEYAYMLFPIKNAEKYTKSEVSLEEVGFRAIDDKTIEVKLENVTPYFGSLVSFVTYMPANKEFVESKGDSYALEADTILYSGPYKVQDWKHNSEMILVKNENYYDYDKLKIDKYIIKYIADPTAALNAYKNGELDIVKLEASQYKEFVNDKTLQKNSLARTSFLSFNLDKDIFKNQNIRKALSLSINKDEIIKGVFDNTKLAAYTVTPKNVGMLGLKNDFVEEMGNTFKTFNQDEAKAALQQGLKELGIDKFPNIVLLADEIRLNNKLAEALQEQFRINLGIDVKVEVITFKERLKRITSREFDIVVDGWGADYQDPITFLDLFTSTSGNNHPAYKSKEYDDYIKLALSSTDKARRVKALQNAEKLLAKEYPIIPIYKDTQLHLVNENVSGIKIGSIGIDIHFLKADKK